MKKHLTRLGFICFFVIVLLLGVTFNSKESFRAVSGYLGYKPNCSCYFTKSKTYGVLNSNNDCVNGDCIPPNNAENPNLDLSDVKVCENPQTEETK
jgi:hypothetical protein